MKNNSSADPYEEWAQIQQRLNSRTAFPTIQEGQIWWCCLGKNIGYEINGKGSEFMRPVLIVRKLAERWIAIVPLTSQPKTGSWYAPFKFQGKEEYAVLSQLRSIDPRRLLRYMGRTPKQRLNEIRQGLAKLYRF